jgi:hypothetical protein
VEDYEEEEHQEEGKQERRQTSLGDHDIGVRLTSEWFEYATVVDGRRRLRGKQGERSVQIMASKSVQKTAMKNEQICTGIHDKKIESDRREEVQGGLTIIDLPLTKPAPAEP